MAAVNMLTNPQYSPDRPGKQLLFNTQHMRVVSFYLEAGQEIPSHVSSSEVLMQVVEGSGFFTVGENEVPVNTGSVVVCASNEPHGMKATERMTIMAVISPRP